MSLTGLTEPVNDCQKTLVPCFRTVGKFRINPQSEMGLRAPQRIGIDGFVLQLQVIVELAFVLAEMMDHLEQPVA